MVKSFFTIHRYFDNKHYPRGFSRYGYFTIKESELLERNGHAYNDLNMGKRIPITDEEHHFVDVCHGKSVASNEHERVWLKYVAYLKKPKKFHTLSGGKPNIDNIIEDQLDVED